MSNIVILFIIVPILALILLLLNLLLATHKPDEAKNSTFECGFSAIHGQTRTTFHIHFYYCFNYRIYIRNRYRCYFYKTIFNKNLIKKKYIFYPLKKYIF